MQILPYLLMFAVWFLPKPFNYVALVILLVIGAYSFGKFEASVTDEEIQELRREKMDK